MVTWRRSGYTDGYASYILSQRVSNRLRANEETSASDGHEHYCHGPHDLVSIFGVSGSATPYGFAHAKLTSN